MSNNGVTVVIQMDNTQRILARRGLESGGKCQKWLTHEIRRLSDPYVPMQSGTLKNTAIEGDDYILYNVPYARYQWGGAVMAGSPPKRTTNKALTYNGAPKRGKQWVLRSWADNGDDIIRGLANQAGGEKA